MAKFEGSAADRREDKRGAKASKMSLKDYENSARDKAEDARAAKKPPARRKPAPSPFGMAVPPGGGDDMGGGDMGGMGGM